MANGTGPLVGGGSAGEAGLPQVGGLAWPVARDRSHGAILGKAMTALARGERGLVLVLVNLQ